MLKNRVKAYTATTGTGPLVPGAAYPRFRAFSAAGLGTGTVFPYVIEVPSGAWEVGVGTYGADGSIARAVEDSSTGALLSLTGEAGTTVALTASASALANLAVPNTSFSRSVYTAPGAIALTDTLSVLASTGSTTLAMTLANGTVDGQAAFIKLMSATANASLSATIDGASQVVQLTASASGTLRDSLKLKWSVADTTWFLEA